MFRHLLRHSDPTTLTRVRTTAIIFFCLALAGCSDDGQQARINALDEALATANAETASLRASRKVLQTRLDAARIAARTAGARLQELNPKLEQLTSREAARVHANAQAARRLRGAESALAHFKGQLAAASRALQSSESRNSALSGQLAALSGWLGQRDALGQSQDNTLKNMQADLKRRASSLASLQKELAEQTAKLQNTSAEAEQLRTGNTQLGTRLSALQTRFYAVETRSARHIAQLQKERDEILMQAKSERERVAQVQANAQQLSAANEQFKAEMESLRTELAGSGDKVLRYQTAKGYLVEQVQTREAQINALQDAAGEARAQHEASMATMLDEQRNLNAAQKKSSEQRIAKLQKEGDEIRAQVSAERERIAQMQANARQLSTANEQFKAEMELLRNELAGAGDDVLRYRAAKDYLVEQVQVREAQINALQDAAGEARAQHEASMTTMLDEQRSFNAAQKQVSEQRIAKLHKEGDEMRAQVSSERERIAQMQANAQQLSAANEQFKGRMESLRNELVSANDNALRYQVAKDYLVDKVQAQEMEVSTVKGAASEARAQHEATVATMLGQQHSLEAAQSKSNEAAQQARIRNETLQAEGDKLRAQLKQLALNIAATEQHAHDAKQAKDYLDGKLSATVAELEAVRTEHRTALLKLQHSLQLSLEEVRVLQQRERELREQLAKLQANSEATNTGLRTRLSDAERDMSGLKTRIDMYKSTLTQMKADDTKQSGQLQALRDQLTARVSAAQIQLEANAKALAETKACTVAREEDASMVRDLKWGNKTLLGVIEVLEDRVRALEALQEQCELHKTSS